MQITKQIYQFITNFYLFIRQQTYQFAKVNLCANGIIDAINKCGDWYIKINKWIFYWSCFAIIAAISATFLFIAVAIFAIETPNF